MASRLRTTLLLSAAILLVPILSFAQEERPPAWEPLAKSLDGLLITLRGECGPYTLSIRAEATGKTAGRARLEFAYADDTKYSLELAVNDFSARLVRVPEGTALLVPARNVILASDSSAPCEAMNASVLAASIASRVPGLDAALNLVRTGTPQSLALVLATLLGLSEEPGEPPERLLVSDPRRAAGRVLFRIVGDRLAGVHWSDAGEEIDVTIDLAIGASPAALDVGEEVTVVRVERVELEAFLAKAFVRAVEILWRDRFPTPAADGEAVSGGGRLVVKGGRRVLYLAGTPREIGRQHGELLAPEVRRTAESVLYVVGLYYAVEQKGWFPDALRSALERMEAHVDEEYVEELLGLAEGAGLSEEEFRLANAMPELFHCSGFAVTGKATATGKLYHGRVLDYMTRIGLQRTAVVIVTRKDGRIPFVNVGYAGFIGCVSGMNAEGIAIGEMGGGGVGKWDGVPMSILVRRVLERCGTLEEVKEHLRSSPRTCEYYYVVSSGKENGAFGVRAVPEEVEFVEMGRAHALLPRAVADCVILSAGSRYETLVDRVEGDYGKIDEEGALALMRRPVAMESNLHNVLFVPEDLVFYVANAGAHTPACDEPYARYDLAELLKEMDSLSVESRPSAQP